METQAGTQEHARVTRRRFTVHEYHRMAQAGILHEDDRVELIEGELIEMAAIGTRHFTCVNGLTRFLVQSVGDEAIVSVRNPVRLDEYGEPQPDLAVIRTRAYRESLPMPENTFLDMTFLLSHCPFPGPFCTSPKLYGVPPSRRIGRLPDSAGKLFPDGRDAVLPAAWSG